MVENTLHGIGRVNPRVSAKKILKKIFKNFCEQCSLNTLADLTESTGKRDRADKRDRRNFWKYYCLKSLC